jgi:hypothetical protein
VAIVPVGASCRTGYRYTDPAGASDGLLKLQARAGAPGNARLVVKGRGPSLELPPLDAVASPSPSNSGEATAPPAGRRCTRRRRGATLLQFKAKSD